MQHLVAELGSCTLATSTDVHDLWSMLAMQVLGLEGIFLVLKHEAVGIMVVW